MTVPESHPRYISLMTRDRLVDGLKRGLAAPQGLIAHGRGEAFDYLLGEVSSQNALEAVHAAAIALVTARRPAISVNGNVASLCPREVSDLANALDCPVEVNLFHRTEGRVALIQKELESNGCHRVLGADPDARIPGLDHARALASSKGIFGADVVLVPLEDGDRCEALRKMDKTVIAIDLNPLSRTARYASITIVDNVVRAIPELTTEVKRLKKLEQGPAQEPFDNARNLELSLDLMARRYLLSFPDDAG
jgi:4-phosphopantoate--beta-alanine ligase